MKKLLITLFTLSITISWIALSAWTLPSLDYINQLNTYMSKQDQGILFDKKITIISRLNITKFSNIADYMIDKPLRRDEASKMFNLFSESIALSKPSISNQENYKCNFSDISQAHSDLTDQIIFACKKWLFGGFEWLFMPTANLTNGQFLAVLIRAIEWDYLDEEKDHNDNRLSDWAYNYYSTANLNGLLKGTVYMHREDLLTSSAYRWDVAIVLANYIEYFEINKCLDIRCMDNVNSNIQIYKYWSDMDFSKPYPYILDNSMDIKIAQPSNLILTRSGSLIGKATIYNRWSVDVDRNGIWSTVYLRTNNNPLPRDITNLIEYIWHTNDDTCHNLTTLESWRSCIVSIDIVSSDLLILMTQLWSGTITWSHNIYMSDYSLDKTPRDNQWSPTVKF